MPDRTQEDRPKARHRLAPRFWSSRGRLHPQQLTCRTQDDNEQGRATRPVVQDRTFSGETPLPSVGETHTEPRLVPRGEPSPLSGWGKPPLPLYLGPGGRSERLAASMALPASELSRRWLPAARSRTCLARPRFEPQLRICKDDAIFLVGKRYFSGAALGLALCASGLLDGRANGVGCAGLRGLRNAALLRGRQLHSLGRRADRQLAAIDGLADLRRGGVPDLRGVAHCSLRHVQHRCGGRLRDLRQICRRFQIGPRTLPHVRQPCRDYGALAYRSLRGLIAGGHSNALR